MFDYISKTKKLSETLETIESYVTKHKFAHIISLNTENFVEASKNPEFQKAFSHAEIVIADGVGIGIAGRLLGMPVGDRITGVDLMKELVGRYKDKRILFVGGNGDTAQHTLGYFSSLFGTNHAWSAILDANKHDPGLIGKILHYQPNLLFLAFGSPAQELWIENHREQLHSVICMGVGQAMDVYGGNVQRAPQGVRWVGFEWLYRLIAQPWRWKRQTKLLKFINLLICRWLRGS